MIRLLMADDHGIVREGLKQLFSLVADIEVAGEAINGNQVLDALRKGCFDLLLLDMTMPGISGVELIARIRIQHPKLPILVLSMHNEPQIVKRALKAGAAGYLTKDSDPERLLYAIHKVAGGGRYIDPTVAEQIALDASGGNGDGSLHEQLSDREFEILKLLAKGMGVNEIAAMLSISNKTVSTHKARLMEKMDIKTNAELVRYALINRLVD
ncbi:MAG: response regulator transcription factor [Sulfuritalea sp.]|jgi:DNA-binding NarL/FixJ family response regulator|nr:response regulator transcription factor [Sulfuritalea sp.]